MEAVIKEQGRNLEENLREASCFGDERAVKIFVDSGVNINSKHEINGWTALHWAAKRGHHSIVNYLMKNGADKNIMSVKGEKAEDLTDNEDILKALGASIKERENSTFKSPISVNYLNHVLGYKVDTEGAELSTRASQNSPKSYHQQVSPCKGEIVIKIRVAGDFDFIEIDLPLSELSFNALLRVCCKELKVDPKKIVKVRKLPNTRVRNDKDVLRFIPFQELELVMSGQQMGPQLQPSFQIGHREDQQSLNTHLRQSLMDKSAFCRNGTLLY